MLSHGTDSVQRKRLDNGLGWMKADTLFVLHPRLEQDCILVGRFELCRLLMMNDSLYPWFILVPERAEITEIYQLSSDDQRILIEESSWLSANLAELYRADKMNVAAIGNMVPQLHLHHIVRYVKDKAWPSPVWGMFPGAPYSTREIENNIERLRNRLGERLRF